MDETIRMDANKADIVLHLLPGIEMEAPQWSGVPELVGCKYEVRGIHILR
jgi:hypothetical protein